MAEGALTSFTI